jgi:hypothetical protein
MGALVNYIRKLITATTQEGKIVVLNLSALVFNMSKSKTSRNNDI